MINVKKLKAEKVKASELKMGDLFSNVGQTYWDEALKGADGCVGEKLYVRTASVTPNNQKDKEVYKITIEELG
jgi:hypothetical protein